MLDEITSGSIQDIQGLKSGGYSIAPSVTGMPLESQYWFITLIGTGIKSGSGASSFIIADRFVNPGEIYVASFFNGNFKPWVKIATAEPPQEFNLPLPTGMNGPVFYSKDSFQKVLLMGGVSSPTAFDSDVLAGVLPVGYRPDRYFELPMTVFKSGDTFAPGIIGINSSIGQGGMVAGGVYLKGATSANFAYFDVTFHAS